MKKVILLTLFVLISFWLSAQSWTFINPNERYHFQHVDDTIPMNTVLVDSVTSNDSITTYHLNRLFLPCDTYEIEISSWGDTIDYYMDNQPTFLQREVKYYQASNTIELINPNNYTLHLPGSNIDEWWFDAQETQKANLLGYNLESWFGIEDSVVSIAINGKPQIKIGKTLGLLKYFDNELSGLEYERLGKCLPGFWEFYDFQVGDILQYQRGGFAPDGGPCDNTDIFEKEEVMSVIKGENKIEAEVYVEHVNEWYPYCGYRHAEYRTNTYHNSKNLYENCYSNQIIKVCSGTNLDSIGDDCTWSEDTVYTTVLIDEYENMIMKRIGYGFESNESNLFRKMDNGLYKRVQDVETDHLPYEFLLEFFENIGWKKKAISVFEIGGGETLIGFVHNADTVGSLISKDYSIGVDDEIDNGVSVLPNPSSGQLIIDLGIKIKASIEIINLQGQLIESFEMQNKQTFNLDYLNPGIYIVSVAAKQDVEQFKWIKQ